LTNSKDTDRLALLKEVAGTRVYEDRRQESLKIVEETQLKRRKIDELLEYIEGRLSELEEEKEELNQYQQLDKNRKCLGYTIYSREQTEVIEQLEQLEENRHEKTGNSNIQVEVLEREKVINQQEQEIARLQITANNLNSEKLRCEEEIQEYERKKTQLELHINDILENSDLNGRSHVTWLSLIF
jgi:structural maintenance of chromosome 3 (chondroitin sulfate proteoglycan 6)